jgi:hypothetical protein
MKIPMLYFKNFKMLALWNLKVVLVKKFNRKLVKNEKNFFKDRNLIIILVQIIKYEFMYFCLLYSVFLCFF